jgi:tetratricopeptide (TPR) repeat protein
MGHYDDALSYLSDAVELEPLDYETLALTAGVLTELSRFDEAQELFKQSWEIHHTPDVLSMIAYVEALRGRRSAAERIIESIETKPHLAGKSPLILARIHMALGQEDVAYDLLHRSLQKREIDLFGLTFDPRWKRIRHDPRFIALIEKVRLLAKKNSPSEKTASDGLFHGGETPTDSKSF